MTVWWRKVSAEDAETQMAAAARRGDRRAFDALVCAHDDALRRFLTRRVGPDALEDVLQETRVAAWLALPRWTPRARFRTWLFHIALHKSADQARLWERTGARETPIEQTCQTETEFSARQGMQATVITRLTATELLACLTGEQREVLELYYYSELTLPEIARVLERNLNTVKYQFYRAHTLAADAARHGGISSHDLFSL